MPHTVSSLTIPVQVGCRETTKANNNNSREVWSVKGGGGGGGGEGGGGGGGGEGGGGEGVVALSQATTAYLHNDIHR